MDDTTKKYTKQEREAMRKEIAALVENIEAIEGVKEIRAKIAEIQDKLNGGKVSILAKAKQDEAEAKAIIERLKQIKKRTLAQRAELADAVALKKSAIATQKRINATAAHSVANELKMQAIVKNLTENGIKTENEVKEMLKTRKYLESKGIGNLKELKERLEPPKQ